MHASASLSGLEPNVEDGFDFGDGPGRTGPHRAARDAPSARRKRAASRGCRTRVGPVSVPELPAPLAVFGGGREESLLVHAMPRAVHADLVPGGRHHGET